MPKLSPAARTVLRQAEPFMNRHLAVAAAFMAAACYIDWEAGDPKSLLIAIADELVDHFERIRLSEIEQTDNKFKSQ